MCVGGVCACVLVCVGRELGQVPQAPCVCVNLNACEACVHACMCVCVFAGKRIDQGYYRDLPAVKFTAKIDPVSKKKVMQIASKK